MAAYGGGDGGCASYVSGGGLIRLSGGGLAYPSGGGRSLLWGGGLAYLSGGGLSLLWGGGPPYLSGGGRVSLRDPPSGAAARSAYSMSALQ